MDSKRKRVLIGVMMGLYVCIMSINTANIIWNADWKYGTGDIVVQDSYAYIASFDAGLIIIDINNPTAPVRVGHLDTPGSAVSLAIVDSYAYITDYDAGLIIVDISNPSAPQLVNQIDSLGSVIGIDVEDKFAYIIKDHIGFIVLDISTPLTPIIVNQSYILNWPRKITVVDSLAYIVDNYADIIIINVSTPSTPVIVNQSYSFYHPNDISVIGSYAYIISGRVFWIYNISTPTLPILVGQIDTPGKVKDIVVINSFAYITDVSEGILVFDVRTPSAPTIITQIHAYGDISSISVVDSYVFITVRNRGLLQFDINNPFTPVSIHTYFMDDSISIAILIITNSPFVWIFIALIVRIVKKRRLIFAMAFEEWFTQHMNSSPILLLSAYRSGTTTHKISEQIFEEKINSLSIKHKFSGIWLPSLQGYAFLPYFSRNLSDILNQQGDITLIQWAIQLDIPPEDALIILKVLIRNGTTPVDFNPQTLTISHRNISPSRS